MCWQHWPTLAKAARERGERTREQQWEWARVQGKDDARIIFGIFVKYRHVLTFYYSLLARCCHWAYQFWNFIGHASCVSSAACLRLFSSAASSCSPAAAACLLRCCLCALILALIANINVPTNEEETWNRRWIGGERRALELLLLAKLAKLTFILANILNTFRVGVLLFFLGCCLPYNWNFY